MNLDNLIDTAASFALFRRFFRCDIAQIISELLQNAQRAQATRIDFRDTSEQFTVEDNGTGIADFSNLLMIAKTGFPPEVIAQQNPMGVGFYALLSHESVASVQISSHCGSILIDVPRWWADLEYAASWQERVNPDDCTSGTKIVVQTTCNLFDLTQLVKLVRGYSLVNLAVFANEKQLDNQSNYPDWTQDPSTHIALTYKGQNLKICTYGSRRQAQINWFGQIISQPFKTSGVGFILEISDTAEPPVDLVAPSRDGVIENQKWQDLLAFVNHSFISTLLERSVESHIDAETLRCFYQIASPEQKEQMPLFLYKDMEERYRVAEKSRLMSSYFAIESVFIIEGTEIKEVDTSIGIDTLNTPTQTFFPFSTAIGVTAQYSVNYLWRLEQHQGEYPVNFYLYKRGCYALTLAHLEVAPDLITSITCWTPSPERCCIGAWHLVSDPYAVDEEVHFSSDRPEAAVSQYIDCFANIYASGYEEFYWDSEKADLIARLMGDAITKGFSYADAVQYLGCSNTEVATLNVTYSDRGKKAVLSATLNNGQTVTKQAQVV